MFTLFLTTTLLSSFALVVSRSRAGQGTGVCWWGVCGLLMLPILLFLPKISVEIASGVDAAAAEQAGGSIWLVLWAVGAGVLVARECWQQQSLRAFLKTTRPSSPLLECAVTEKCRELQLNRIPAVRLSDSVRSPFITGLFRPVLVFPRVAETWDSSVLDCALTHELMHLQRKDLFKLAAGRLVSALYWFNPFAWGLNRALRVECEFGCDSAVVRSGVDLRHYVDALCRVASHSEGPARMAMSETSSLEKRVKCLIQPPRETRRLSVFVFALGIVAAVAANLVRFDPPEASGLSDTAFRLSADPFPADRK